MVVSRLSANETALKLGRGVITVVPLTSKVERTYSMQVPIGAQESGLDKQSKAQAEQVRSIDVSRMRRRVGHLSPDTMAAIDQALRLHLDL